ncbi:hypothetical protein BHM03_00003973 [Ensete ventricosum]|nr:hypothetical protein BHM03_00003973 [Ensete ventricosum]
MHLIVGRLGLFLCGFLFRFKAFFRWFSILILHWFNHEEPALFAVMFAAPCRNHCSTAPPLLPPSICKDLLLYHCHVAASPLLLITPAADRPSHYPHLLSSTIAMPLPQPSLPSSSSSSSLCRNCASSSLYYSYNLLCSSHALLYNSCKTLLPLCFPCYSDVDHTVAAFRSSCHCFCLYYHPLLQPRGQPSHYRDRTPAGLSPNLPISSQ